MKSIALLFLTLCAPLFSQNVPDNAAAKSMENRLKTLNLQPPKYVLTTHVNPPVCAIPLITVVPKGNFAMPIVKPPADRPSEISRGDTVQVPAPACEPKFFRNK